MDTFNYHQISEKTNISGVIRETKTSNMDNSSAETAQQTELSDKSKLHGRSAGTQDLLLFGKGNEQKPLLFFCSSDISVDFPVNKKQTSLDGLKNSANVSAVFTKAKDFPNANIST